MTTFPVEKCFKHPDRIACNWRENLTYGEPERVPLCLQCMTYYRDLEIVQIYPLNERRMRDDKHCC